MRTLFVLAIISLMSGIAIGQEMAQPEQPGLFALIFYYVDMVAQGLFGLMILATAITRLVPGDKDDALVDSIVGKLAKGMSYLPTFGINPRTKQLEAELKAMKEQKKP